MNSVTKKLLVKLTFFFCMLILSYSLLYAQDENKKNIYKNQISTSQTINPKTQIEKKTDIDLSVFIDVRRNHKLRNKNYQNYQYASYYGGPIRFRNLENLEYWVKIIRSDNDYLNNNHLLVIKPNTLHSVELFIPTINTTKPIESSKSNTVNTIVKYSKRAVVFTLPETQDYKVAFLRIKSKSNTKLDVELWNADEYYKEDMSFNIFLSMLYGVLLIAIVINVLFFITLRQRKYLLYSLYVIGLLVALASASGKIFEYTLASYLATSTNKIILVKSLSALLLIMLIQNLASMKSTTTGLFKCTEGVKLFFALIIGLCIALRPLPGLIESVFNLSIILLILPCSIIPLMHWQLRNRDIRYIFYSIIPIIIAFIIYSLTAIESLPKNVYTHTAMQVGFVLHALIIAFGLSSSVFDIRKQLHKLQENNRQQTLSLKIEKQHADLINHVKNYVRFNPNADQDHEIVTRFFEQLKPLFSFEKAALVYQVDSKLQVKTDLKKHQSHFTDLINDNLIEITRLCHGNSITEIKPKKASAYFHKKTKLMVIPVFLRGQEWSGMLINLKDDQDYSEAQKNSLHRYATEVVRSLLNTKIVNDIRNELKQDPITKLLNRSAIFEELDLLIKDTQYSDKPSSIALLKVSDYININEDYGTEISRSLLNHIGDHLKAVFKDKVFIGRIANADFLLLFKDTSAIETSKLLNKMREELRPMPVKDTQIDIEIYLAVSQCYGAFETARDIMRRVDKGIHTSQQGISNDIIIQE